MRLKKKFIHRFAFINLFILFCILVAVYIAYAGSSIQNQYLDIPLRNQGGSLTGVYTCPAGSTLTINSNGQYICVSCANGRYNPQTNRCEADLEAFCSMSGFVLNTATNICESQPNQAQCPAGGNWDNNLRICVGQSQTTKSNFSIEDSGGVIWYSSRSEKNDDQFVTYNIGFKFNSNGEFEVYRSDRATPIYTVSLLNGSGNFWIGYPAFSDGDYAVSIYISNMQLAIYTTEDDNASEWSGWGSIFGGTVGVPDAWFALDGGGHFAFQDRKGFNSGWRPLFCPLNSFWNGRTGSGFACLTCVNGYSFDVNLRMCIAAPICRSGYSYNRNLGLCERCVSANWKGVCTSWDRYNPATDCLQPSVRQGNACIMPPEYRCPNGYIMSGNICISTNTSVMNITNAIFTN